MGAPHQLLTTLQHTQEHAIAAGANALAPAANPLLRIGSRRWFLQVGACGLGLSLPELLRARAEAATTGKPSRPTSVIQIWLSGGPSQIDMWDMKPGMPSEIRGPFSPIATSAPGIEICEHLPLQAKM